MARVPVTDATLFDFDDLEVRENGFVSDDMSDGIGGATRDCEHWDSAAACNKAQGADFDSPSSGRSTSGGSGSATECSDQDAYYAFLRDFAGSFEAGEDDSDGEDSAPSSFSSAPRQELDSDDDEDFSSWDCLDPPKMPHKDDRPPVAEDYDLASAIADFASSREGDADRRRREHLRQAIDMTRQQARRLLGVSRRHHCAAVRANYTRICCELEADIHQLESQLRECDVA